MTSKNILHDLRADLQITESLQGHSLSFQTTWGLFSPRSIDTGSRLLLEHMPINPDDNCLDLGCGYGVLGIVMAKSAPQGKTTLVDKDFVAVEYSQKNCTINQLENCEVFLSNGFSHIPPAQKFTLIASNLPAKTGNEMLTLYMHDAFSHLHSGGRFYVVTITGLRKFIERSFKEVFGNYKKVKQGKTYTVAVAVKS